MSHHDHDPAAVQARLWDEIEDQRTGMLGMAASGQHYQPMTAFVDREANQLWFFTLKDTDLARAADGGMAMFVFQQKDLQACIGGSLSLAHDAARIERYWNPIVAAWYPQGKDDPNLTLLRFDCADAEVWVSKSGPLRFAWEIAKANAGNTPPDLGDRTHLNLH